MCEKQIGGGEHYESADAVCCSRGNVHSTQAAGDLVSVCVLCVSDYICNCLCDCLYGCVCDCDCDWQEDLSMFQLQLFGDCVRAEASMGHTERALALVMVTDTHTHTVTHTQRIV